MILSAQSITIDANGDSLANGIKLVQLRKVYAAAQQRDILLEQVGILNKRIENYQSIINTLNEKDSVTVASYEAQIKNIQEVVGIYESELKAAGKRLKKERRKRKWTSLGGIALTGIATYFYITK